METDELQRAFDTAAGDVFKEKSAERSAGQAKHRRSSSPKVAKARSLAATGVDEVNRLASFDRMGGLQ